MAVNLMNLPKITGIKHSIEPLWASDAGRNSNSGKYSGTFVGYFNKLEVSVGRTTQYELQQIRNNIEVPIIENVTFLDSKTGTNKTDNFYGSTITTELKSIKMGNNRKTYPSFTFSLTAIERRNDM